jgi:hypothetical protein
LENTDLFRQCRAYKNDPTAPPQGIDPLIEVGDPKQTASLPCDPSNLVQCCLLIRVAKRQRNLNDCAQDGNGRRDGSGQPPRHICNMSVVSGLYR